MASGVADKDLKEYFERAQSWDTAEAERARKERRTAYLVAAGGVAVAFLSTALYLTSPLKIVEPYVVRVDERSGAVDVMSVVRGTGEITAEEAVRKYFLAEYVRSREAFIPKANDELYRKTLGLSSQQEGQRLRASRDPAKPGAPVNQFRGGQTANVVIRSIAFVSDRVGQVRFSRLVEGGGGNVVRSDWVATVQFDFSDAPTNDATRFYNPLGFVATSYRVDSELPGGGA